jgi:AraC family transcriptional regulator, regulatory protein of adaptative response / methylated-DNA-[protein]-cysteine methyltransferase
MANASDYARIERAIRFLEDRHHEQPALEDLAGHLGLSPFHLQRLFSRWAGVSPKRFLQFLTVEHAKAALRESRSVLEAAYATGMSGPGRLHDLFVAVEAVTPGEFKSGGAGLTLRWGLSESPFGTCFLAATDRGVCALSFVRGQAEGLEALRTEWPSARLVEERREMVALTERIFSSAGKAPGLLLKGTNFQLKVWSALLRVPQGAVTSYEALAADAGLRGATRAVASAVAANPVAYLIPCHRVIRKSAQLGEYHWGAHRKQAILAWEAAGAH